MKIDKKYRKWQYNFSRKKFLQDIGFVIFWSSICLIIIWLIVGIFG